MIKLALAFLILIGLTFPAIPEEKIEVKKLASLHDCTNWKDLNSVLVQQFNEKPLVIATGLLDVIGNNEIFSAEHQLMIYVNSEDYTYTVLAVFEQDGIACILSSGDDFRPFVPSGIQL